MQHGDVYSGQRRSFIPGGIPQEVSLVYCETKTEQILKSSHAYSLYGTHVHMEMHSWTSAPLLLSAGCGFQRRQFPTEEEARGWILSHLNKPMWILNLLPRCCHTQLGHKWLQTGTCWRARQELTIFSPQLRVQKAELPFNLATPLLI